MSKPVILQRMARKEFFQIYEFYDAERGSLAERFESDFANTVKVIRERPQSFPVARGVARRAWLKRFPY